MRIGWVLGSIGMVCGLGGLGCGPALDPGDELDGDGAAVGETKAPLTEIMVSDRRWRDDVKLDISYCVDPDLGADRDAVVAAMAEATADWSKDVQVAFRYLDIEACNSTDWIRMKVRQSVNYACIAPDWSSWTYYYEYPTDCQGIVGQVRSSADMYPATQTAGISLTDDDIHTRLRETLLHELGHVLGFDHEDGSLGCSEDHYAGSRPLTEPDPASIMSTCQVNTVLSPLDRQGAGLLYGHVEPVTFTETTRLPMGSESWILLTPSPGANRKFTVSLSGTGNVDLYAGAGFRPTTARYSAASTGSTSKELIELNLDNYPFGQEIWVNAIPRAAGTVKMTIKYDQLKNPLDLVGYLGDEVATFVSREQRPVCGRAGRSCSSGDLLYGRGRLLNGVEPNAPNHVDFTSCNDGNSGRYRVHESLEALRIRSADSGPLRPLGMANVEVEVFTRTLADRVDLYYLSEVYGTWTLVASANPTVTKRSTLTFPLQLGYGGPVQSLRAVFRYNPGAATPCPSDMGPYDDIDDLGFTVAPAYRGTQFP